jgi:diguanylate cyclase (GGDEF)-like protein
MDEPNISAVSKTLSICPIGAILVDYSDWQVVFANRSLRAEISEPPANSTDLFCWFPKLADLRPELQRVADRTAEEALLPIGAAGVLRARPLGPYLVLFLERAESAAKSRLDPLTGLADRAFFLERLGALLSGGRANDHRCAVLFVDVDGFKQINDTHGHLVGDRVLREVARRLAGCVRAGDHVARFGGDEFVVLLESVRGVDDTDPVAERIRMAFEHPIQLPEGEVTLAVSVGAAVAGPDERSAEALINAADRAMYAAKRAAT